MGEVIIVYGTRWCGDTRRARKVLEDNSIPYEWVDIDRDIDGRRYVEKVNRGFRSVPTILFPDGSVIVEPSNEQLRSKLGL
jgi:glutaredoxin-like protein